ncbi:hypothetical protein DUNSADRAFT_1411 [Dunaliella salina]|uniref:Uncharacterized protein n=1 Tax=Dunaliella salina TaxID=3046 RepID=A0ABQ7GX54_DUNSA|nr:hypothetical protein DUNSADRAFT_1411 [Dunaliella salina]KAF5839185.1 hypothetical protein DUNSADRAFT_1411 [Dunaliella salina]|eukprot:KAF5839184.1 hypothetical protein DUNSADRAFT_1411 [Dunaliella salina]
MTSSHVEEDREAVQQHLESCRWDPSTHHPGKVVSAAAVASLAACTRDMATQLADFLHSKLPQSRVVYCTSRQADQPREFAKSPSSNRAKQLWSLSHAFILVQTDAGSNLSAEQTLLVEPNFRSHFELPRASNDYTAFLSTLPELLVVEAMQMQPLVAAMSKCVAHEFKRMDLPLPPWRTTSALQSRWRTNLVIKERVVPPDPFSCTASRSSSTRSDSNAASTGRPPSSSTISVESSSSSTHTCSTPQVVVQGFHLPAGEESRKWTPAAAQAPQTPTGSKSLASTPNNSLPKPRDDEAEVSMLAQHQCANFKMQGGMRSALQTAAADTLSTHIRARWQSFSKSHARVSAVGERTCAECGHSKGPVIFKAKMMGWPAASPSGRPQPQSGLQQLY